MPVRTVRTMPIRTSSVPVWLIKLVTVVIAILVLVLIALQGVYVRQTYSGTYIITALTCGVLLGWSLGSVLQQALSIRNVEIIINLLLTVLTIVCLVLAARILIKDDNYSSHDWYKQEIGVLVIAIVVSLLMALQPDEVRKTYSVAAMVTALTIGVMLGWSLGSVLQQGLSIRNVEIIINLLLTALSIVCLALAAHILIREDNQSKYDWYKQEVGMLVCFVIQTVICFLMLSWAWFGKIVVVQTVQ